MTCLALLVVIISIQECVVVKARRKTIQWLCPWIVRGMLQDDLQTNIATEQTRLIHKAM